jgi:hypothetical protein
MEMIPVFRATKPAEVGSPGTGTLLMPLPYEEQGRRQGGKHLWQKGEGLPAPCQETIGGGHIPVCYWILPAHPGGPRLQGTPIGQGTLLH